MRIFNKLKHVIPVVLCIIFLALTLRGLPGVPDQTEINNVSWKQSGPFELSPERGRFALLYSLVENGSVFFSLPLARFVAPDLGYANGNYVSIFAPGVSIIAIPGFLIGKALGFSQVGAFATISLFATANFVLIFLISKRVGASYKAGWLSAFLFLFATPAFAYAVNFYQHHVSTFLILFSIYLLTKKFNWMNSFLIWTACALALLVDYPNVFMMAPIGLIALGRFFGTSEVKGGIRINIKLSYFLSLIGATFPIVIILLFNYFSFDNPFQISGTVSSVIALDKDGYPAIPDNVTDNPEVIHKLLNPEEQDKSVINFFSPRSMINGIYVHLFSPDRGVIFYAPLVALGIAGAFLLYKKRDGALQILLGVLFTNFVLYSMWGDPWGGWAFGSRYLIPSYAVLAIMGSIYLSNVKRGAIKNFVIRVVLVYAIAVNTLGAITTNANPPKGEAEVLGNISGRRELYSFRRNWEYLIENGSKSFLYNTYFVKDLTPVRYYFVLVGGISIVCLIFSWGLNGKKGEK